MSGSNSISMTVKQVRRLLLLLVMQLAMQFVRPFSGQRFSAQQTAHSDRFRQCAARLRSASVSVTHVASLHSCPAFLPQRSPFTPLRYGLYTYNMATHTWNTSKINLVGSSSTTSVEQTQPDTTLKVYKVRVLRGAREDTCLGGGERTPVPLRAWPAG